MEGLERKAVRLLIQKLRCCSPDVLLLTRKEVVLWAGE